MCFRWCAFEGDGYLAHTHVGKDIDRHLYNGQREDPCVLHRQLKEKFIHQ
jgi:hypothetical protein